jgi:hypothetical protein
MRSRSSRILRIVAAAVLAACLVVPAAPGGARAAGFTFGTPQAESTYDEGITFTVPFESSAPVERVEIRFEYPAARGVFIAPVPLIDSVSHTLTYRLDLASGDHLVPNTTLKVTWAAYAPGSDEPTLSATETVLYADTSQEWQTLKGSLVVVHWVAGDEAFAKEVQRIGDDAVRSTAKSLGVTETEPIDFFIYPDDASFRTALGPGARENVGGEAHPEIRTLFAELTPEQIHDSWVGVVIPHELVHVVFDTAVDNPYTFPSAWVNEGLAVYLSEGYTPGDRNLVADAVASNTLPPLESLTGNFPRDPNKTYLAYAEAVSAIAYLVDEYGEDALWSLVKAYKEGLTDDEAFTRIIGKDVAAFQDGWLAYLGAREPTRYGPQSAPPGPLPPGWSDTGSGTPPSSPGTGNGSTAATPAPSGRATTAPGSQGSPAQGGGDGILILAAVLAVVLVVVAGMLVARRRTSGP